MDLQLGSRGDDVKRLEQKLKDLSLYTGSIDGSFGGGVQSAVKSFQKANGVNPDGVVGAQTWALLFPGDAPPATTLLNEDVARRCLALTGSFETSSGVPECFCGLTGDFDEMGISYGALQWNLGQGTLQPLLSDMLSSDEEVLASVFHDDLDALKTMLVSALPAQLQWARSIQDPHRHTVFEPWKGMFAALGRTPEFQAIQLTHADRYHQNALSLCNRFGVRTERALALMFDICVQNGTINNEVEAKIRGDFAALAPDDEVGKLQSIANRRAETASAKFVEDVRIRKLTIANGKGTVHNVPYDLEQQFGIRLQPMS